MTGATPGDRHVHVLQGSSLCVSESADAIRRPTEQGDLILGQSRDGRLQLLARDDQGFTGRPIAESLGVAPQGGVAAAPHRLDDVRRRRQRLRIHRLTLEPFHVLRGQCSPLHRFTSSLGGG
jgi:hypothetical protein